MATKSILFFAFIGCIIALSTAMPLEEYEPEFYYLYEPQEFNPQPLDQEIILSRQARSPQRGRVSIDYNQDRFGKRGSVQYNHNLHTSRDGRFKVDAYGQASRDFTHNRNSYGGGLQGSWRF